MQNKKIIVANWKMNPDSVRKAKAIFLGIKKKAVKLRNIRTVICSPAVYIGELKRLYKNGKIALGAQDCFGLEQKTGTGEISSKMLKSVGADFVIVGHSERRKMGENDMLVNQKMKLALRSGLNTILCVGEDKKDEDGDYFSFVEKQLLTSLNGINKNFLKNILIAYEPVWAIGKNAKKMISADELRQASIFIRKVLADKYGSKNFVAVKILYGGSVDYKNAGDLIACGGVDGFLVGRESLIPERFNKILETVDRS